jgi:TrmH family RNA methyltransferase
LGLRPLAWYKKLDSPGGRQEAGSFLIEGERAVYQTIQNRRDAILEILLVEGCPVPDKSLPCRILTSGQFKKISGNRTPQGIAAVLAIPREIYSSRLPGEPGERVLLLENVQDPGNTGSLIRTAAAFGFSGVILTVQGADPLSPKVVQAAAGSLLSLWIRRVERPRQAIKDLLARGYLVVATDLEGKEGPHSLSVNEPSVLVLGNEASGVSSALKELASYRVRIPVNSERVESLNVAVCGAICMFCMTQRDRA